MYVCGYMYVRAYVSILLFSFMSRIFVNRKRELEATSLFLFPYMRADMCFICVSFSMYVLAYLDIVIHPLLINYG